MKKIIALSFCFLVFASLGFSQSAETSEIKKLSVQEAVDLAAQNNISLKRQKVNLDLLEKRNNTSWNSINPSANISGSYGANINNPVVQTWSVSGSINLTLTPSLITAINGAKLNYENGLITYDEALRTIELNVRKTYYNLLFLKENVSIQEKNLDSARKSYNSSATRYNRGQLSELNLLNSQYSYESLKPTVESARINYENSVASFKQMLGIPQSTEIELTDTMDEYLQLGDIEFELDVETLPAVQSIKRQIEIAKNNLMATRFTAWGPSISAGYSYGVSGTFDSDTTRTTNSANVSVRIPLDGYLPWSSGSLSIESQKSNLKDLELQLENQKTSSLIAVESGLKKINQSKTQINTMTTNVNIATRKYNATATAYSYGSADYLSLQSANDALLAARLNKQSQIYTYISNILDLENTLGIPFGTLGK